MLAPTRQLTSYLSYRLVRRLRCRLAGPSFATTLVSLAYAFVDRPPALLLVLLGLVGLGCFCSCSRLVSLCAPT